MRPQDGWSGRRRRSVQTVSNLPAGTSYFTADCLTLPTWANYTDYPCASCMAKLCNYEEPVCMIMCHTEKKKILFGFGRFWVYLVMSLLSNFLPCVEHCYKPLHEDILAILGIQFACREHDPAEGSETTASNHYSHWEQGQRLLCWSSFERV